MIATLRRNPLRLLWLGALLLLAGCGFQLRGNAELPFDSLFIDIPQSNIIGAQLARNLRNGSNTKIVDNRAEAQVILTRVSELRGKTILSINSSGRVREFRLIYTFNYSLLDQKGEVVAAPTSLSLQRDYSFSDDQVLAKESEELLLYRDMQSDLVQQIIRRLSAARAPATGGATPTPTPG